MGFSSSTPTFCVLLRSYDFERQGNRHKFSSMNWGPGRVEKRASRGEQSWTPTETIMDTHRSDVDRRGHPHIEQAKLSVGRSLSRQRPGDPDEHGHPLLNSARQAARLPAKCWAVVFPPMGGDYFLESSRSATRQASRANCSRSEGRGGLAMIWGNA